MGILDTYDFNVTGDAVAFTNWAQTYSANYENTYISYASNSAAWNDLLLFVSTNSANWIYQGTDIKVLTANWETTFNIFSEQSANNILIYNTVASNSGNWSENNGNTAVNVFVISNSANIVSSNAIVASSYPSWDAAYTNIINNSAAYLTSTDISFLATLSANWNDTYNTVLANSAEWESAYNNLTTFSAAYLSGGGSGSAIDISFLAEPSGNWNSTYNTVLGNSADWELAFSNIISNSAAYLTSTDISFLVTPSGNWNSTYNTVLANSAEWETAYNNIISNSAAYLTSTDITFLATPSANWNSVFTTVGTNSSEWELAYNNLISNSAAYLTSTDISFLATPSANWNSTYNSVIANSSEWELAYNNLISNSATYLSSPDITFIQSNSAGWENIETVVQFNSASWASQSLSAYVLGPISSIAGNLAMFTGSSGKIIEDANLKRSQLAGQLSTGILSGGFLTVNADPTKFNISDGFGLIVDTWNNVNSPVVYDVQWTGLAGISSTFLTTSTFTHVYINSSGSVVQLNATPVADNFRDYIYIGQLGHTTLSSINATVNAPVVATSPTLHIQDIQRAMGIVNTGNTISSNGANLRINKSVGTLEYFGINYTNSYKSPNIKEYSAVSAPNFRTRTRTGNGTTTNTLDVGNWDVGGIITPFVGSKAQNFRVYLTIVGNLVIQYGQTEYTNMPAAIAGLQTESFTVYPNLAENATLIGIISVESNTTSLADTNKCRFFSVSKFGEVVGANAGSSVSTLQNAYNNSSDPEILTDSTRGALTIRRGSTTDLDKVLSIQNGGGLETSYINGSGYAWFNNSVSTSARFYDISGNSIQWNTAYTNLLSNSAAYLTSTDITFLGSLSSGWESSRTTVFNNSAFWGGADNQAVNTFVNNTSASILTVNTVVSTNSALWAPQTLSFSVASALLTISNGNSVSLSALSSTGGGGGLVYLTETLYTTSPNNTDNAVELKVTGGSTNADLVLNPKGTGAFIAFRPPDSTATGGNKRGTYAVDLQGPWRNGGNDVASGTSSSILGGRYNRASDAYSAAMGYLAIASSQAAMAFGYQAAASGFASFVCGYLGSASASQAFVGGGESNTSSATNASSFGRYALASRYGMQALCSGPFSTGTPGDAQHALFVMRNKTTTNSEVELFLDGSSTRLTVPSGRLMGMFINLMGVKSDGTAVAHYMRQYAIKNVAGTTSEVYTPVTIGVDTAAGTTIAITANDTNDALRIGVTGITSEIWRWVAVVQAVEIVHGT